MDLTRRVRRQPPSGCASIYNVFRQVEAGTPFTRRMPPNRLVRFLRIELGISEAELGSRVEMTQSAISKLERSCEGASISVIRRLLRATNCELVLWAEPHRSFKLERMRWAEARFLMARRLYDEGKRRRPSEFSEMDP